MPNVLTHRIFAECNLKAISSNEIKKAIEKFPKAYILGSSGPDFFFYYNVWPWTNQDQARKVAHYGSAVHNQNINAFYSLAIDLIHSQIDSSKKQAMIAFLAGHLCHWALDSVAHPYIFYRSGAPLKKNKYWHYRLESMIDTMMVKRVEKQLKDYPPKLIIDYDRDTIQAVTLIYQPILKQIFDIDTDQIVIEKSIHDFHRVLRVLFDPKDWKIPLVKALEEIIGKPWIFSSHMVGTKIDCNHDVLNLNHKEWIHPSHENIVSTKSFIDLFDEALLRSNTIFTFFDLALKERASKESILNFIADQDYETGMSDGKKMQNYACIYDEKGEKNENI